MTYHQEDGSLVCHYCGREQETPSACMSCGGQYIYFVGVGTEQLEEIVRKRFPQARVARVDRDVGRRRGAIRKILLDFSARRLDVLVGTQIVAKGHDFPNVTLVGVVAADSGLAFPDFRSAERTFQLLTQVAGRAGRGSSPGRVVIQSFYPDHYALTSAKTHDYVTFFDREIEFRRQLGYPPFREMVQILISDADPDKAFRTGRKIAEVLKACREESGTPDLRILGPAAAPLEKLRGKYRIQLLVKLPVGTTAVPCLQATFERLAAEKLPLAGIHVDVDPLSLL
jgi:primosomal protein N' (replication factor Y) (superfamily II helicase)